VCVRDVSLYADECHPTLMSVCPRAPNTPPQWLVCTFLHACKTTFRPTSPLQRFWLRRAGDRARSSGERLGFYPRSRRSGNPDDHPASRAGTFGAEAWSALLNIIGAGRLRLGAAAAAASGETEINFGVIISAACQMDMHFMAPIFR